MATPAQAAPFLGGVQGAAGAVAAQGPAQSPMQKHVMNGMLLCAFFMWGGSWKLVAYGLIAFIGMLFVNQETMLYAANPPGLPRYPEDMPPQFASPQFYGMEYENIAVDAEDGVRCHAWMILQPKKQRAQAPTVLYLHGNAGNIGMRLPLLHALFTKLAINVMALDYRGYGRSKGKPSEEGLNLDAAAALAYLTTRADIDATKVVVFGRSLGGAVGASLASTRSDKLAGLVLENTFISVAALAQKLFFLLKFLGPLVPLLIKSKWDTKSAVRVGVPRAGSSPSRSPSGSSYPRPPLTRILRAQSVRPLRSFFLSAAFLPPRSSRA